MFPRPDATNRSVTGIPTGRLAVWWIIASEIFIFGGLILSYLMFRLHHPEWGNYAAETNVVIGGFNTFVLLTSSLFIVLAHKAIEDGNRDKAYRYIWYTIGGGAVFLIVKSFEWSAKFSHGITITTNNFWSCYFTMTGLHAFHVICGMIIMAFVASAVKRNENLQRVEFIGIYWHFVDVVWIFLFPLFYIAK